MVAGQTAGLQHSGLGAQRILGGDHHQKGCTAAPEETERHREEEAPGAAKEAGGSWNA